MARMFIDMPERERQLFINTVYDPRTKKLAEVLVGAAAGGSGGTGFIDFLLQSVTESFSEKVQVSQSLSDNFVVYLFGQNAPQFSYQGTLLNTYQDDQKVWMTRLYQDVLRGTQLARRKKLLKLRYDSVVVTGVMTNLQMGMQAGFEDRWSFSFNLIPLAYVVFTPNLGAPTRLETPFLPSAALALSQSKADDGKKKSKKAVPPNAAQAAKQRASGGQADGVTPDDHPAVKKSVIEKTPKQTLLDRVTSPLFARAERLKQLRNVYGAAPVFLGTGSQR